MSEFKAVICFCATIGLGMYAVSALEPAKDEKEEKSLVDRSVRFAAGSAGVCLFLMATVTHTNKVLRDFQRSCQTEEDR